MITDHLLQKQSAPMWPTSTVGIVTYYGGCRFKFYPDHNFYLSLFGPNSLCRANTQIDVGIYIYTVPYPVIKTILIYHYYVYSLHWLFSSLTVDIHENLVWLGWWLWFDVVSFHKIKKLVWEFLQDILRQACPTYHIPCLSKVFSERDKLSQEHSIS